MDKHGLSASSRTRDLSRIYLAMARYPGLVGSEGRFDTLLMQAFDGALIGKVGADGCYGIGVRTSEHTRSLGTDGALGIAVKVEDGNMEILYAVVAEALKQLRIGTSDVRRKLAGFHHLARLNTMGMVIGHVSLEFQVRAHGSMSCVPNRSD